MPPLNLLFLCPDSVSRGLLAEGLARHLLGPAVVVRSAGTRPGRVHPLTLRVLAEVGVDTEGLRSKLLGEVDPSGVDLVVTVSSEAERAAEEQAEEAPLIFPDAVERRRWALPDPAAADEGATEQERLLAFRAARDHVHARILALARERGLPLVGASASAPPPRLPTVAVVGWKNAGKTTLVERLVATLAARGLRVGAGEQRSVQRRRRDLDLRQRRAAQPLDDDQIDLRQTRQRLGAVLGSLVGEDPASGADQQGLDGAGLAVAPGVLAGGVRLDVVVGGLHGADPQVFLLAADAAPPGLTVPVRPRDDIAGIADAVIHRLGLESVLRG